MVARSWGGGLTALSEVRIRLRYGEGVGVAELAKIGVVAAPACPGCRNRLTGLPLDDLVDGAGYQCPFCGEQMRIPRRVIETLIQQREELRAAQNADKGSFWRRMLISIRNLFAP